MKVVINKCYGGFGLSKEGMKAYARHKGIDIWIEDDEKYLALGMWTAWLVPPDKRVIQREDDWHIMTFEERAEYNDAWNAQTIYCRNIDRNDPALVAAVEELQEEACGRAAELKIVEIPDDVVFSIEEYDGREWVAEVHRVWS